MNTIIIKMSRSIPFPSCSRESADSTEASFELFSNYDNPEFNPRDCPMDTLLFHGSKHYILLWMVGITCYEV